MKQMPQKEMVLLYNIKNKPFTPKLKSILLRLGIRIKIVEQEQFNTPIGTLVSGTTDFTIPAAPLTPFTDEMIVMIGFTNARLDLFLSAMKKEKVFIPLKAILTPQNSTWTAHELRNELAREHKKMMELSNQQ